MSDLRTVPVELLQQALEALDNCTSEHGHRCNRCDSEVDEGGRVIAALRVALEQPSPVFQDHSIPLGRRTQEQPIQPVAWLTDRQTMYFDKEDARRDCDGFIQPLDTHPPRREWQGLTEEEIDSFMPYCHNEFDLAEFKDFARAIEAALKEKNHE
jgi:hypothetical protein